MELKNWIIKNIALAGGIILTLLILIFLLGNNISGRTVGIKNKNRDLAARLHAIESLSSLKTDAEKTAALRGALENLLPAKDQLIKFSKTLENYAKNNKMDFGFAFESEIPGAENTPGINNFILTSGGDYSNFLRFLNSIEQSKYLVKINYLELTEKENSKYGILIKGKVFSQ